MSNRIIIINQNVRGACEMVRRLIESDVGVNCSSVAINPLAKGRRSGMHHPRTQNERRENSDSNDRSMVHAV